MKRRIVNNSLLIKVILVITMTLFLVSCQGNDRQNVISSQGTSINNNNDNLKNDEESESISNVGITSGMDSDIPAEEQKYIDDVLSKITKDSSKNDVIKLLGTPNRDLGLKVNWWVTINGKQSRVGVYFSSSGNATRVNLDGGPGRFYYRTDLE